MATTALTAYRGDFIAWTGGCGLLGLGGGGAPIAPHAHYAIQLAIGWPRGLKVQFGRRGDWQSCAAALVPSRAVHSIDVQACEMSVVLFIEPETRAGKALGARLQGRPELLAPSAVAAATERLASAWRGEGSYEEVTAACDQLVRDVSQTTSPEPADPRVLAAIDYVGQRIDRVVPLAEVAAAVHLSPGRLRHLFVEETGMPLRSYVLWRRLLHVLTELTQGETLAQAAQGAGFADAAHLSRTARTMFGLPPSALQVAGPLSLRACQHRRAHRA